MARVELEIGAKNTEALNGLKDFAEGVGEMSAAAKKSIDDQKTAFKSLSDGIKNADDQIKKNTDNIKQATGVLGLLRQKVKELGEQREFAKSAEEVSKLTAEIKKTQLEIDKATGKVDVFGARIKKGVQENIGDFFQLGEGIVGAFNLSALVGFGAEGKTQSELAERALKAIAVAQSLRAVATGFAKAQETALFIQETISNASRKVAAATTAAYGTVMGVLSGEIALATVATNILNVATKALLGPIGIVLGLIGAVAGAMVLFGGSTKEAAAAQGVLNAALNEEAEILKQNTERKKEIGRLSLELAKAMGKDEEELAKIRKETLAKSLGNTIEQIALNNERIVGLSRELRLTEDQEAKKAIQDKIKGLQAENDALVLEKQKLKIADQIADLEAEKKKEEADKKISEKSLEEQKKAQEKRLKLEEDFQKALANIKAKALDAELKNLSGTQAVIAEFHNNAIGIDNLEKELIKQGKLLDKNFKLNEEQEKQFAILRLANEKDAQLKLDKLRSDFRQKAIIDNQNAEKQFTEDANKAIDENLVALQDANKAKILSTKIGSNERLRAEIEAIEKERDFVLANNQLTADQTVIIIKEAQEKIEALTGKNFDIFKLLGLNVTSEQKQAILDAVGEITNSLKSLLDTELSENQEKIKSNQEVIDSIEERKNAAQKALDQELEFNKKGFASNVDAKRAELAALDNENKKALENEKKLLKEQEKLKREQLVLDTLLQASSLITAAANIFKTTAGILPPFGQLLGIAAIATMIGAFVSAKAQAFKLAGFHDAGYTGDGDEWDEAGVVHKKEFVHSAEKTKKHRRLFEAIHKDDYTGLSLLDLAPILKGTGVRLSDEIPKELNRAHSEIRVSKANEESLSNQRLTSIEKNMNKFFDFYRSKPNETIAPDGTRTITKGNMIRIIKKAK